MRVLVLGGTAMVGYAVATEALRRGHQVVCAARGSAPVPVGAWLVRLNRDEPNGLAALAGERFDTVVDVATMSQPWVADALRVLGADAGHWTFVSTINVYADTATRGRLPGAQLLSPRAGRAGGGEPMDPTVYGAIKVASENTVLDALGERAFVVRPGLITGPGDAYDRFGYWPARMLRGGRMLVPDVPGQPIQYVDVRDLASWIVSAGEQRLTGVYDGICPSVELSTLLADIASVLATRESIEIEFAPMCPAELVAAQVNPWGGPRSLPLWLPSTHWGMCAHDATPSAAAGLRTRPLDDVVAGALARERELGLDRNREAGLSGEQEAEILAAR